MDERLRRVIERLSNRLSERPRLPDLAREAGVSVRLLELLFKSHTGRTFVVFYRELRMKAARDLLARTNQPVKEIAARLGYRAVEVFCRDFRRTSGQTPLEYRAAVRKVRLQKTSIKTC
jgi:transcriptional regulator GlxA family with amidase domain